MKKLMWTISGAVLGLTSLTVAMGAFPQGPSTGCLHPGREEYESDRRYGTLSETLGDPGAARSASELR